VIDKSPIWLRVLLQAVSLITAYVEWRERRAPQAPDAPALFGDEGELPPGPPTDAA
jgi:hypothetical protein